MMLEKFYFECFLIAFSALIGALFSCLFGWTIKESKMDRTRKFVFIGALFLLTIFVVGLVLFLVISLIGASFG
jgi:hypothetical protein